MEKSWLVFDLLNLVQPFKGLHVNNRSNNSIGAAKVEFYEREFPGLAWEMGRSESTIYWKLFILKSDCVINNCSLIPTCESD